MARAVIEIGAERIRLLVADPVDNGLTPQLERYRDVVAARLGARAVASMVEAEAVTAQQAGATSLQILISPELRGSHLCRGLERRLRAAGLGNTQVLTAIERGGLAFRGATSAFATVAESRGPTASGEVAVVEIGETATTIAAGGRGGRPRWWASRPLNARRLGQVALHADPPSTSDQQVGLEFARSQLATLKPPRCQEALLSGRHAGHLALLCGERLDADACRRAGAQLSAELSEIVAARLSIDLDDARQLPSLLAIARAAGELLGRPLRIVHAGPAEGFMLQQSEQRGSREAA